MKNTMFKIVMVVVNIILAIVIVWNTMLDYGAYCYTVHGETSRELMLINVRDGAIFGVVLTITAIVAEMCIFKIVKKLKG